MFGVAKKLYWVSFVGIIIPFVRVPYLWPNHFPKTPLADTFTLVTEPPHRTLRSLDHAQGFVWSKGSVWLYEPKCWVYCAIMLIQYLTGHLIGSCNFLWSIIIITFSVCAYTPMWRSEENYGVHSLPLSCKSGRSNIRLAQPAHLPTEPCLQSLYFFLENCEPRRSDCIHVTSCKPYCLSKAHLRIPSLWILDLPGLNWQGGTNVQAATDPFGLLCTACTFSP